MKKYSNELLDKYLCVLTLGESYLLSEIFDGIIGRYRSHIKDCSNMEESAASFFENELSGITRSYESQPIRLTKEFRIFRFLKDNVGNMEIPDDFSVFDNETSYWLLFYTYISCLVRIVRTCDESDINRVQRAMDKLCSECPYI